MNRWSDRRVTLIGDAGYSPGPAVGGGTSVAVIGAYLLADALRAEDDPRRAFDRYENAIREMVTRSRRVGPTTMKTLIPATARQAWLTVQSMRLIPHLPPAVQRRLFALQAGPATAPGLGPARHECVRQPRASTLLSRDRVMASSTRAAVAAVAGHPAQ